MIFLNSKKKKLDNIYNKIAEQSKQSFYFDKNLNSNVNFFIEFFQTNLILILWFIKFKNMEKKYTDYLVNKFIKDLEGSVIELGVSETSLRKKIRVIIENFYGRLYSYSKLFDSLVKKNEKTYLKKTIKKNFNSSTNINLLEKYIESNFNYLKELKENDFWDLKIFKSEIK